MSDLIDRQALLKQIDIDSDGEPGYYGDTWKFIDTIKNMPNVHDLPKDADTISRQAAIDAIGEMSDDIYKIKQKGATYPHDDFFQGMAYAENIVKQLPSAQPERIRGHWIDGIIPNDSGGLPVIVCDQCNTFFPLQFGDSHNFCPNCGADMRGEQE